MKHPESSTLDRIADWLRESGHGVTALQPLAGDVSTRRYVRTLLADGSPAIVAVYPSDGHEVGERFVRTTELLIEAGVRVPRIFDWSDSAGLMLLEDAGDVTVHQAIVNGAPVGEFHERAAAILRRIASLDRSQVEAINPPLDGPVLRRELQQSWERVLEPRGLSGDDAAAAELLDALRLLCDKLHEGPREPGHRDFMARNLMVAGDGGLIVIDHQDLRLTPRSYDLASMLNDTVYATPLEEAAVLEQLRLERSAYEGYHRCAAQRALKIVGTFAMFAERGSPRYLDRIPPSLAAARRHLLRLPETGPIMGALVPLWERRGIPAILPT